MVELLPVFSPRYGIEHQARILPPAVPCFYHLDI